jgi:MinD superfamily P-loop ATPase
MSELNREHKTYYDAKLNNDCENCQRCHLICEEDNVCYREEDNEKNTI